MPVNKARRLVLVVFTQFLFAWLNIPASFASDENFDRPQFVIGGEACSDYLRSVAKDPSLQTLYDSWLAGYVKIATEELPVATELVEDADMADARAWVKAYCSRRATDSFLTATVRFLEKKERYGLNVPTPDISVIRVADRD